MAAKKREYDLVVYGAASFVGKILSRYLLERHGVDGSLRWALAGRNQTKLDALKSELNAPNLSCIIADAADQNAVTEMAKRAKVIVSTVGPYALYGSGVVAACAEQGTDYCDLTGEPQWIRAMIDAHEATAQKSGARIVHSCGFDSIPSDLGVYYTQQRAQEELGTHCSTIKMRVKRIKGGMSGGTAASLANAVKEMVKSPELRKLMQNPYALAPSDMQKGVRQPNIAAPVYEEAFSSWAAPFIMAGINTRIVHRSHALLERAWGDDFVYDEGMLMGDGLKGRARATGMGVGLGGFMGLMAIGPTGKLLSKYALPAPGEGPSPAEQEAGLFDIRFWGESKDGQSLICRVTGDRDPGYGSTGKMLGEAAVCLAHDKLAVKGGFWTPATAMGDALIERLKEHAGLTFTQLEP